MGVEGGDTPCKHVSLLLELGSHQCGVGEPHLVYMMTTPPAPLPRGMFSDQREIETTYDARGS